MAHHFNPYPVPQIEVKQQTTGSVAANSNALVTVTWPTAFPNTNYTPNCGLLEATDEEGLRVAHIEGHAAASITVRVQNQNLLNARTGTLLCFAVAD